MSFLFINEYDFAACVWTLDINSAFRNLFYKEWMKEIRHVSVGPSEAYSTNRRFESICLKTALPLTVNNSCPKHDSRPFADNGMQKIVKHPGGSASAL